VLKPLLQRFPRFIPVALIFVASIGTSAQSKPEYEIYAIQYATIPGFPVSELVMGADPARKLDIAMMIWLVRGNGRNILVDSGFYHDRFFKDWKVNRFRQTLRRAEQGGFEGG
jgi:hypothetical protein